LRLHALEKLHVRLTPIDHHLHPRDRASQYHHNAFSPTKRAGAEATARFHAFVAKIAGRIAVPNRPSIYNVAGAKQLNAKRE
jgi:hypothetical protein